MRLQSRKTLSAFFSFYFFFPLSANTGSLSVDLHLTAARILRTTEVTRGCPVLKCTAHWCCKKKINCTARIPCCSLCYLLKTIMKDLIWKINKLINARSWSQSPKSKWVNFSLLTGFNKRAKANALPGIHRGDFTLRKLKKELNFEFMGSFPLSSLHAPFILLLLVQVTLSFIT